MHTETSDFNPNKSIDYYRAKSSEDQFQRTYVSVDVLDWTHFQRTNCMHINFQFY